MKTIYVGSGVAIGNIAVKPIKDGIIRIRQPLRSNEMSQISIAVENIPGLVVALQSQIKDSNHSESDNSDVPGCYHCGGMVHSDLEAISINSRMTTWHKDCATDENIEKAKIQSSMIGKGLMYE